MGSLSGGMETGNTEIVGELSKAAPTSPRMYQLEPTSIAVGPWVAGYDNGGAVPNKSAADAGNAATVSPATARENRIFIGYPRIAVPVRDSPTLQEFLPTDT